MCLHIAISFVKGISSVNCSSARKQRVVDGTVIARQAIFTEVQQSPLRSSYVLVIEVTMKVRQLRSPPSSNHEG
jgi:hypothetical protein